MLARRFAAAALFALVPSLAVAQDAPAGTVEVVPGLTAKIVSLKRLPGKPIVQIDYELINGGTENVDLDEAGLLGASGFNGVGLLDFEGERIYEVGTADGCLCTAAPEKTLAPGATIKAWAWFMPPETVKGPVAVRFGTAMPLLDVPIQ